MPNLNLIPPEEKINLHRTETLSIWLRGSIAVSILVIIGAAGSAVSWWMLRHHAQDVHQQLAAVQRQQQAHADTDVTTTTTTLNSTMKTVSGLLGQPQSWSYDSSVVLAVLPPGTTVTSLTVELNHRFHLTGSADTRSTFLLLDQALKGSKNLTQISTTSAASKRQDVPFDYSGVVVPPPQTP